MARPSRALTITTFAHDHPETCAAAASSWDVKASEHKRPVSIKVVTDDRPGVLAAISQQLSEAGMNITTANCRTIGNDKAVNTFEFAIGDLKALRDVMKRIEKLEGVMSVERLYSTPEPQEAEGS